MQKQAYIINEYNEVVARVKSEIKSGTIVEYGYTVAYDLNGEPTCLVNKSRGKISRAKKWNMGVNREHAAFNLAIPMENGFEDEFRIVSG